MASVTRPVMPDPKRLDEVAAPAAQAGVPVESSQPPHIPGKRGPGRPKTSTPEKRKAYLAKKAKERRDRVKLEKLKQGKK